jgi:hypothetical protein
MSASDDRLPHVPRKQTLGVRIPFENVACRYPGERHVPRAKLRSVLGVLRVVAWVAA